MQLEFEQRGKYLLIQPKGRLDASWSEHFTDTLLLQVREGKHYLVIDASEMGFLSSAGIRALLMVYKELNIVNGSFVISNPTSFVEQTLSTSGFQMWLKNGFPEDMPDAGMTDEDNIAKNTGIQLFVLNENALLTASESAGWLPWQAVEKERVQTLAFSKNTCALGIGSAGATFEDARDHFGEFLAVAGNVVYQPPDEQAPPDYLISEKQFLPRMQCIQSLSCKGDMAHLIRFAPTEAISFYSVSDLLTHILDQTVGKPAGFVVLGEIEGLVGTSLIRSPGRIGKKRDIDFPEIRDWLTFCGERSYSHQQALMTGVVSRAGATRLPSMPSAPDMAAHIHGAVFPYQPLPNGKIELETAIAKFFNGPPPLAVMHLTDDDRPVVGLGESALLRGACWFSPLQNPEVLS